MNRLCLNSSHELNASNSVQLRENKVSLNPFSFLDATMTTQDASQSLANSLTKMQAGLTESSPGNCFISAHLKL